MASGMKLMVLSSYAFAASALLVICISAAAIISVVTSGQPVCLPGLSIRCHENDCGRFFQRCGSDVLLEIPAQKVCHGGILLPASRTDLHSCPSAAIASNSSQSQAPEPEPDFRKCSCDGCVGATATCNCKCFLHELNTGSPVIEPTILKTNPSNGVSQCGSIGSAPKCAYAGVRRLFTEVSIGQWSLQDVTTHFTFPPPLSLSSLSCCTVSVGDPCYSQCG